MAAVAEVAHEGDGTEEDGEFQSVGGAVERERQVERPEDRLGDAHGPDTAIEVAALVAFARGGGLDTRQFAERAEDPHRNNHREIPGLVDLLQHPLAGDNRRDEPGEIQDEVRDGRTPREGVADAAIERVGPVFGETDDVRGGFAAGQFAAQPGEAGGDHHYQQPPFHVAVEAVGEQLERKRAGDKEKDENPDGPVVEAVIGFVARADFAFAGVFELDLRVHAGIYSFPHRRHRTAFRICLP